MTMALLKLQKDLLLEQLMDLENQLNDSGIKKEKKGFTLVKDEKKRWLVRYIDPITKKQMGKRLLDGAKNKNEAEIMAEKFRLAFIKEYNDKKNGTKDIITLFADYYKPEKSKYLQELLKAGKKIGKKQIVNYNGFINNHWIPFLTENKIKKINEINIKVLTDFQLSLLEKKLKPKTINDRIARAIKPIFSNLVKKGVIKDTPFLKESADFKFNLPEKDTRERRGILKINETLSALIDSEIWKLYKTESDIKKGIVANPNHYKKYRLLCLLITTCGLRNAEIFMLRKENIIKIRRTYFLDIVNSHTEDEGLKTENAKRKVPIPSITLQALNEYIAENKITDYLFYNGTAKTISSNTFIFAKNHFGAICGYSIEEMKKKKIVFYSSRHFYKTLLSLSKINESVVEYFSGRKVDVRKMNENYKHIEDIDDEFLEEIGLQVIEYIDDQFKNVINKLNLFPIHTHIEQVCLTNGRQNKKVYFAEVLNKMDFENETYLYLTDLTEKGVLSPTNDKNQLESELKNLLENGKIEKRKFDDCLHYLENTDFKD